jgi:rhodanese-related sulfurtransferase
MGNTQITQKCNFEDVQSIIKNNNGCIINTLKEQEQTCLIKNTLHYSIEEKEMNDLIKSNYTKLIIVYGKHSNDDTVYKKYEQLIKLGFVNVYIYTGGLFEWLCLQDIFGEDMFPTTSKELDLLKYSPSSVFVKKLMY